MPYDCVATRCPPSVGPVFDKHLPVFDKHLRRNISVYMFDIKNDPTESNNLANRSAFNGRILIFY